MGSHLLRAQLTTVSTLDGGQRGEQREEGGGRRAALLRPLPPSSPFPLSVSNPPSTSPCDLLTYTHIHHLLRLLSLSSGHGLLVGAPTWPVKAKIFSSVPCSSYSFPLPSSYSIPRPTANPECLLGLFSCCWSLSSDLRAPSSPFCAS